MISLFIVISKTSFFHIEGDSQHFHVYIIFTYIYKSKILSYIQFQFNYVSEAIYRTSCIFKETIVRETLFREKKQRKPLTKQSLLPGLCVFSHVFDSVCYWVEAYGNLLNQIIAQKWNLYTFNIYLKIVMNDILYL